MSITSSIYVGLNPQPIDRIAASMFFKTPWWADVPFNVQKSVIESRLPEEKLNIDFFKAPPLAKKNNQQMEDLRGRIWINRTGSLLVVTGYADCREEIKKTRKRRAAIPPPFWIQGIGNDWIPAKAKEINRIHYWWSMFLKVVSRDELNYKTCDFVRTQASTVRGKAPR